MRVLYPSASFTGRWFDGRSAVPRSVRFALAAGELVIESAGDEGAKVHPLAAVRIAEPLGHAPRVFDLPDGSVLQAEEGPALAAALRAAGHRESKVVVWQRAWPASLVALVALVFGSMWLYAEGLPQAADWGARNIPADLEARLGEQAMQALDSGIFLKSALLAEEQTAILAQLAAFEKAAGIPATRRLEFRTVVSGEGINAFSLPGGTIVLLDDLVDFAGKDTDMLLAVLAHEAGHQAKHHMTRSLLRGLGGAALAGLLWGDYSSVASHTTILFGQLGYSRDDEEEADEFAIEALRRADISPAALARFFLKVQSEKGGRNGPPTWASTHPDADERAERAMAAAEEDDDERPAGESASMPSR